MGGKKKNKDKNPITPDDFKVNSDVLSNQELGNKAFLGKDYEKAIGLYTQAIQKDSKNPIYYNNRAAAHYELKNFDQSLQDAKKAAQIDPNFSKAFYRQGKVLYSTCETVQSYKAVQKALQLQPHNNLYKDLFEEVEEEYKEDNVLPPDHPEAMIHNDLLKVLLENESRFDKLKIRYYRQGYRGVHAKKRIKKNQQIMFIPKDMIITLEMAKAAPIGKKMKEAQLDLLSPKHCFLTSYILQERKNAHSKWKFFLEILPKALDNFPIFYGEELEKLLEGSPFLDQVKDKRRDIKKDYEMIAEVAPQIRGWDIKQFSEVRMMVSSRIFGMNIEGTKTDGFVPMADMLNHKRPRQTSWTYTDEKVGFVIESCEDIDRNQEVFDSYGKKCNSRFFLNYGFIVENNDGNEFPIKCYFKDQSEDSLLSLKKSLLADPSTTFRKFRVSEDMRSRNTRECLSFLRYVEYDEKVAMLYQFQSTNTPPVYTLEENDNDDQDDQQEKDDTGFKATNIPAVSVKNERAVLQRLKGLSIQALSKYPSAYEEDLVVLKDQEHKLDFNSRNCILMVSGEKKVLKFIIKVCDIGLDLLESKNVKDARAKFKAMKSKINEGGIDDYFNTSIIEVLKKQEQ